MAAIVCKIVYCALQSFAQRLLGLFQSRSRERHMRVNSGFLRRLAVVLALAMAASACGSSDSDGSADGNTDGTEAPDNSGDSGDSGDSGGDDSVSTDDGSGGGSVLVHAADDEASTLDPAQVEPGEGGETIILQVYERLLEIGPDGPDLIPALATEVPSTDNGLISADGLTYTFPLREGVTFHDGTPMTADDVKYSWDRVMTMDLPDGAADVLNDIVDSTAVVDDNTFEVTLQKASAAFLNTAVVAMVSSIVSQDAVEANGGIAAGELNEFMQTNMVGTGPYTLTAWNRGENIQLSINEDYWGTPANNDVRIEIGATPDVRVLGLRAGEYDTIEADPSFIGDLEGAEGVTIAGEGSPWNRFTLDSTSTSPMGPCPTRTRSPPTSSTTPEFVRRSTTALTTKRSSTAPSADSVTSTLTTSRRESSATTQQRLDMTARTWPRQKNCSPRPATARVVSPLR